MLSDPLFILMALVMIGVVVILAVGIANFGKGTVEGAKKSNKMMQYRLGAQFVAVVMILIFIYVRRQGG